MIIIFIGITKLLRIIVRVIWIVGNCWECRVCPWTTIVYGNYDILEFPRVIKIFTPLYGLLWVNKCTMSWIKETKVMTVFGIPCDIYCCTVAISYRHLNRAILHQHNL